VRRSAKRGDRPDAKNGASPSQRRAPAAKTPSATGSAKTTPAARAAKAPTARRAKPAATRAAAASTARRAKPAARAAAKPAADVAGLAGATRVGAAPRPAGPSRTVPRRKVPPAGYAAPEERGHDSAGSGTADLLGTTIQAVAELAQIGVTVGRQTLQSMIDRLPKP
jgi:hypothetical protein